MESTSTRKETNKELFARYAEAFGLEACGGLPGGQRIILDEERDIAGSFETTDGAYTAKKPIFQFRQYRYDGWSGHQDDPYTVPDDDASKAFTREEVLQAIAERKPLHDVRPDRRIKNKGNPL